MIRITYPEPQFKIKEEGGKHFIFDTIRKTWLVLTDEEWVRQNFVHYLINSLHYPATVFALEKEIMLHNLKKRFDVLVYDHQHQPWMLIECKGPNVPLNEEVLQQVLRYNISVPVPFIVLTNGKTTIGWRREKEGLQLLQELPAWNA